MATAVNTNYPLTPNFVTVQMLASGGDPGAILSSSPTGGVGYATGSGSTVSQATFTLTGVTITGTGGQFSCTASTQPLVVGSKVTISGTLAGTGTITGYATPTTYYVVATNGSTTFTLSTTAGGSGVVTTAGTPTGLTYTTSSKSAGLTINTPTGQVVMSTSALATTQIVSFLMTNPSIGASDTIVTNLAAGSYATIGTYSVKAESVGVGQCYITIKNESAGSLAEAIAFNFAIVKGSSN